MPRAPPDCRSRPPSLPQSCLGLRLPPLLGAVVQLAAMPLVAAANWSLCETGFMQHPRTAARTETAYLWLQFLFAPLEPLLWAAGVGPTHPHRRCHCGEAVAGPPRQTG